MSDSDEDFFDEEDMVTRLAEAMESAPADMLRKVLCFCCPLHARRGSVEQRTTYGRTLLAK